jgi:hypothetical protein
VKAFISYRRDDSAGHTGRLYDSLRERFGQEHVFLDHSGIDSGQNFADVIQNAVRSCDVLLAVIGREWLTSTANGSRRLDDPGDLVRTEIVTALERKIPVIPVLVNRAPAPSAAALPEPLKPLAGIDAHEVSDERWAYDVGRLIAAMEKLGGVASTKPVQDRRTMFVAAAALALVAIVAAAFVFWPRTRSEPSPPAATATAPGVSQPEAGQPAAATAPSPSTAAPTAAAATSPVQPPPAADVAGEWTVDVTYDWGATHPERFKFIVDGTEILGTASFLKTPRGILNGSLDGDRIVFETRTQEVLGDWNNPRDIVHRYRGRISGDTIMFTMQSTGGSSSGVPLQFTAKRAAPAK